MFRKFIQFSFIGLALMSLSACAGQGGIGGIGPKAGIGALVAGALGGYGGSQICDGDCGNAMTAVGAITGLAIGYGIGDSLDNIDRMYAEQANQKALNTAQVGQGITWNNPQTGNSGTTVVTNRGTASNGAGCAAYSQTIYVQGKAQTATGTACQRQDGTWQIQG